MQFIVLTRRRNTVHRSVTILRVYAYVATASGLTVRVIRIYSMHSCTRSGILHCTTLTDSVTPFHVILHYR